MDDNKWLEEQAARLKAMDAEPKPLWAKIVLFCLIRLNRRALMIGRKTA